MNNVTTENIKVNLEKLQLSHQLTSKENVLLDMIINHFDEVVAYGNEQNYVPFSENTDESQVQFNHRVAFNIGDLLEADDTLISRLNEDNDNFNEEMFQTTFTILL